MVVIEGQILDLFHHDVCVMNDKYLGWASYFVNFIDDHSRKLWAFVLKSKDQALSVFKNFHTIVQRKKRGRKLKSIRAHNGGEYIGSFEDHYK